MKGDAGHTMPAEGAGWLVHTASGGAMNSSAAADAHGRQHGNVRKQQTANVTAQVLNHAAAVVASAASAADLPQV